MNRKPGKVLALGLALVRGVTLMTGCANSETPSGGDGAPPFSPSASQGAEPAATGPAAWTSVDDLKGAKIAVQEGTTGNDVAAAIDGATVSAFKAATACAIELMNGRVDCVVIDTNPAKALVAANPDKLMLLISPPAESGPTLSPHRKRCRRRSGR